MADNLGSPPADPPAAVSVSDLSRRFDEQPALVGVSFQLAWRDRALLLGPNGAGKTTLLRVLATLLRPSAGQAVVAGYDVVLQVEGVRRLVGYVGHQTFLYDDLTVAENLRFYSRLYGLADDGEHADRLVNLFDLNRSLNHRVRTLSRGWQQRAALARALLHRPKVLLLDEPDTGLDKVAFATMTDFLASSDCTMLISTHSPDRFERLANRVIRLERGRLVDSGVNGALRPAVRVN